MINSSASLDDMRPATAMHARETTVEGQA